MSVGRAANVAPCLMSSDFRLNFVLRPERSLLF